MGASEIAEAQQVNSEYPQSEKTVMNNVNTKVGITTIEPLLSLVHRIKK